MICFAQYHIFQILDYFYSRQLWFSPIQSASPKRSKLHRECLYNLQMAERLSADVWVYIYHYLENAQEASRLSRVSHTLHKHFTESAWYKLRQREEQFKNLLLQISVTGRIQMIEKEYRIAKKMKNASKSWIENYIWNKELVHAIRSSLFKQEIKQQLIDLTRQTFWIGLQDQTENSNHYRATSDNTEEYKVGTWQIFSKRSVTDGTNGLPEIGDRCMTIIALQTSVPPVTCQYYQFSNWHKEICLRQEKKNLSKDRCKTSLEQSLDTVHKINNDEQDKWKWNISHHGMECCYSKLQKVIDKIGLKKIKYFRWYLTLCAYASDSIASFNQTD